MAKQLAATLLLLGLSVLAGCLTAERLPPADQSLNADPNECKTPPADQIQREAATSGPPEATMESVPAPETEITVPAADEEAEPGTGVKPPAEQTNGDEQTSIVRPNSTDIGEPAMAESSEPNDVPTVEPDDVRPVQPNNAATVEPDRTVAFPGEPNDPAAQPQQEAGETAIGRFYREYGNVLNTYVLDNGLVDYSTLDRRRLDLKSLLADLDALDPNVYGGWSKHEKLAFWINTYNIKMLEIVTRNYPIQSSWWLRLTWPPSDIRHIKGIWTEYKFLVMDEEFTLAEVEQRFFRKTFDDPRAYLAITYASRSSPSLRRTPYRGESIGRQLDQHVKAFLASQQGIQIDRRNRIVRLSALFKPSWRGKEFVSQYGTDKKFKDHDPETRAVLNFVTGYLLPEDVSFLEVENYRLEYMNFDWRLNDTSKSY